MQHTESGFGDVLAHGEAASLRGSRSLGGGGGGVCDSKI